MYMIDETRFLGLMAYSTNSNVTMYSVMQRFLLIVFCEKVSLLGTVYSYNL